MTVVDGFCPVCESSVQFSARDDWFRDYLVCPSCPGGSLPRDRALALVLSEMAPGWRKMAIHECSPANRGVSWKLAVHAAGYTGTHFYRDRELGKLFDGYRNENLECLTFEDEAFDLTVTLDVMEHVYHPDKAISEIYRTLKPGGLYVCTFPVRKEQATAWERRFEYAEDGSRIDIKTPEFHGSPADDTNVIVTIDWGHDLHQQIAEWAPFDVRVHRFADRKHGILGEYTDVIVCRKPKSDDRDAAPVLPETFDEAVYLRLNPDVAAAGVCGSAHWLEFGRFELRRWRG